MIIENLQEWIAYVISAHQNYAKSPMKAMRRWDGQTPYSIHSIWCAMTILTEEKLSQHIRVLGCKILLLHDVPEDTIRELPDWIDNEERELLQEMLYEDSADERLNLWGKSDLAKLFKLYDKVSNLLDSSWMLKERGHEYYNETLNHASKLVEFVEGKFGELNIVIMAKTIISERRRLL